MCVHPGSDDLKDKASQNCSQGAHVAERYRQETKKEKDRLVRAAKFRETAVAQRVS